MDTVRVFSNGRSQAVSIPKEYRFDADEVFINKIGDVLLLTPAKALASAFDKGAAMLTDDFLAESIPESIPSVREVQSQQITRGNFPEWLACCMKTGKNHKDVPHCVAAGAVKG